MIAARWIRMERACRASFAGFALAQASRAAPAVLWTQAGGGNVDCALVVPRMHAPGRKHRWAAWALAPLVAGYRLFGLRAYLEDDAVCLSGDRIATCEPLAIGECAVVVSNFLPVEGEFMEALRGRIEAQQGWQFDHSWPSPGERAAMDGTVTAEASGA
jgi:hypothetical protein